jgi:hypothetical protein
MSDELCRTIAYEAVRRGARSNVDELWAVLEHIDGTDGTPLRLVVDIGSGPAVWFAWWAMGAKVLGLSWPGEMGQPAAFSGERLPSAVTVLVGDPRDAATVLRVSDQVARRPVDVLVLADIRSEDVMRQAFTAYAPMVRDGGLVLVHGIADRRMPGVGNFWRSLDTAGRKSLIGSVDPIGYGIVEIHGKDRVGHG